jgi:hypothetical protein
MWNALFHGAARPTPKPSRPLLSASKACSVDSQDHNYACYPQPRVERGFELSEQSAFFDLVPNANLGRPASAAAAAAERTLYVFVDESGNFDFTAKGTDHFVLSAVYTHDPCRSAAALQRLKYELLAKRSPQLEFHATENSRGTRTRVAEVISGLGDCIRAHTLYVDKHYAHPNLHSPAAMLGLFGKAMARWVSAAVDDNHDQVVLVFDSVLTGKQRDAFSSAMKPALKALNNPTPGPLPSSSTSWLSLGNEPPQLAPGFGSTFQR